jgi:hypothetical protein
MSRQWTFENRYNRELRTSQRAYPIRCSDCGKIDTMSPNNQSGTLPPDVLIKHFQNLGWVVGKKPKNDLCPMCVRKVAAARKLSALGRVTKKGVEVDAIAKQQGRSVVQMLKGGGPSRTDAIKNAAEELFSTPTNQASDKTEDAARKDSTSMTEVKVAMDPNQFQLIMTKMELLQSKLDALAQAQASTAHQVSTIYERVLKARPKSAAPPAAYSTPSPTPTIEAAASQPQVETSYSTRSPETGTFGGISSVLKNLPSHVEHVRVSSRFNTPHDEVAIIYIRTSPALTERMGWQDGDKFSVQIMPSGNMAIEKSGKGQRGRMTGDGVLQIKAPRRQIHCHQSTPLFRLRPETITDDGKLILPLSNISSMVNGALVFAPELVEEERKPGSIQKASASPSVKKGKRKSKLVIDADCTLSGSWLKQAGLIQSRFSFKNDVLAAIEAGPDDRIIVNAADNGDLYIYKSMSGTGYKLRQISDHRIGTQSTGLVAYTFKSLAFDCEYDPDNRRLIIKSGDKLSLNSDQLLEPLEELRLLDEDGNPFGEEPEPVRSASPDLSHLFKTGDAGVGA